METLYILFGSFVISLIAIKITTKVFNYSLAGRIAMSVMLLFTAIGHFIYTEGMVMLIPDFFPIKTTLVYLTGILEICAAIGLMIPRFQKITAWLLIIFFVAILPANINAALNNIDLRTGSNTGPGAEYLWFRIPLQILFIVWTYFFGIKMKDKTKSK
jgi:uncharacterized membrane protein